MHHVRNNSGLSIIATVLTLLLFSLFIAVAVSLVTTGSNIGVQEEQGVQTFFIADGGIYYTLAKNSTNSPNYSTNGSWINLGSGQFKVDTPAYLTANIAAGAAIIPVDSTALFPSAGRLTIGSDFGITYTGKNASQFTGASGGQAHAANKAVYPAARVTTTIPNDPTCATLASIDVGDNTGGFVIPGIIFIDTEYFYCASKTALQFQTCQRCYLGSSPGAHPIGRFASQYIIKSTGRITNPLAGEIKRTVQITAGPQ